MARTKGALNKRTRAVLHELESGDLKDRGIKALEYGLKIIEDTNKPDQLRLDALRAVLPYLQPRLSNIQVSATVGSYSDLLASLPEALL